LNPQHQGDVGSALSFNTSVSFVTNTNWQNYGGESTMSYFSQIGALTVQQFVSPPSESPSPSPCARFARRNRRQSATSGSTSPLLVLHPLAHCFRRGHHLRRRRCGTDARGTITFHDALNGVIQTIPRGPIGFMEAIKQLGTNGGGFLDQNSATPFENPTGLTNFLSIFLLLSIPFALTYTFGKMVGSVRHGATLLAAMVLLFGIWVGFTSNAEHQNNRRLPRRTCTRRRQHGGQGSAFRRHVDGTLRVASTMTSTGSADASYDSFTPSGTSLLSGMMLGEVTPVVRAAVSTRCWCTPSSRSSSAD